jgi:hypothetical protein
MDKKKLIFLPPDEVGYDDDCNIPDSGAASSPMNSSSFVKYLFLISIYKLEKA